MISPKICHCTHYRNMSKYVTVSTTNTWDIKYVTVSNTWARKDTVTSYCTKYPLCIGSGVGDLLNMVDVYATIKWQEKRKKEDSGGGKTKAKRQKSTIGKTKVRAVRNERLFSHTGLFAISNEIREAPFWNVFFPNGHCPKGGVCVKGLPVWFGALFSHVWPRV